MAAQSASNKARTRHPSIYVPPLSFSTPSSHTDETHPNIYVAFYGDTDFTQPWVPYFLDWMRHHHRHSLPSSEESPPQRQQQCRRRPLLLYLPFPPLPRSPLPLPLPPPRNNLHDSLRDLCLTDSLPLFTFGFNRSGWLRQCRQGANAFHKKNGGGDIMVFESVAVLLSWRWWVQKVRRSCSW